MALFAVSLIWLIALVTHEPADPVWFFTAGDSHPAANFVGLVGAFISEVSLQVLGYASFLVPVVAAVAGWSLFWCRAMDSAYTKSFGAGMFLGCLSALFALIVGNAEVNGRTFRAGGYIGEWVGDACTAYLNRPGAIIVVLTLLTLSVIMATQFSFGRTFAALFKAIAATGSRLITQYPELARGTPARSRAARGHRQAHEEERWNGGGRGGSVGGRGGLTHAREGTCREEPRADARRRGRRRRRGPEACHIDAGEASVDDPAANRAEGSEGEGRGRSRAAPGARGFSLAGAG